MQVLPQVIGGGDRHPLQKWADGPAFVLTVWLLSRLLILLAMLVIAPSLPAAGRGIVPTLSWEVFTAWDGQWYQKIATLGYEYARDGQAHSVAFFPLYPLLSRWVMGLGLPFAVAGTLVNNLAFLGMLWVVFDWVRHRYDAVTARWTIAVLVWCPLSLYGTVAYTEGLFLLLSSLCLRAFDRQQYAWAALWGALTTATRITGVILAPTLLLAAWKERRPRVAYLVAIVSATGLLAYILYCAIQFGAPLAFLDTQSGFGHRSHAGFNFSRWGLTLLHGLVGPIHWQTWLPKNPWHPVQFALITAAAFLLWRFRHHISATAMPWLAWVLTLWLWLLWGDGFVKVWMVFGGLGLVWVCRYRLGWLLGIYSALGLGLVLLSGSPVASDRFAYGLVTLSISLGLVLQRYPRWGYPGMVYFAVVLVGFAIRFAQQLWVA